MGMVESWAIGMGEGWGMVNGAYQEHALHIASYITSFCIASSFHKLDYWNKNFNSIQTQSICCKHL
jgi:uncharacterized membrane protein required for colicin V production